MSAPRRITQKDIARAAGLTPATVSLALRNHPSIPESTRRRIHLLATKLGYTPDPMLSALSSYRLRTRPAEYHGTLAWLACTTPDFDWRRIRHFPEYLEGARQQAERHGYRVEIIDLGDLEGSWARAAGVARARGIKGLLLCPQPEANTRIDGFPWSEFSTVTFGYSLKTPDLHSVAPAQYQATLHTMDQLKYRGYRRIGFATIRSHDQRTNHNFLSGYLTSCALNSHPAIPPLIAEKWDDDKALSSWIKDHRLDALVTCDVYFSRRIAALKLNVPRSLGVACPLLPSEETGLSGIWEDSRRVGAAATDFLVAMLHRDECGVPAHPQRLLINGSWLAGRTLKKDTEKSGKTAIT